MGAGLSLMLWQCWGPCSPTYWTTSQSTTTTCRCQLPLFPDSAQACNTHIAPLLTPPRVQEGDPSPASLAVHLCRHLPFIRKRRTGVQSSCPYHPVSALAPSCRQSPYAVPSLVCVAAVSICTAVSRVLFGHRPLMLWLMNAWLSCRSP